VSPAAHTCGEPEHKGPGGVREGAGRPAEAGIKREESVRVLVTPEEKAALIERAGGKGRLSALLRRAPGDLARWRDVADRLAYVVAGGSDDPVAALDEYRKLAEPDE